MNLIIDSRILQCYKLVKSLEEKRGGSTQTPSSACFLSILISFTGWVSQNFSLLHFIYLHLLNHIPCCLISFTCNMWDSNPEILDLVSSHSYQLTLICATDALHAQHSLWSLALIIPWLQSHASTEYALQKMRHNPFLICHLLQKVLRSSFRLSSSVASFLNSSLILIWKSYEPDKRKIEMYLCWAFNQASLIIGGYEKFAYLAQNEALSIAGNSIHT